MITLRLHAAVVEPAVDAVSATWRQRARAATQANVAASRHLKARDGLWSDIKSVFVEAQHGKCAYCERQLGTAGIDWDVEHFRPKSRIRPWLSRHSGITDLGGASGVGYFRLAFQLANYLVSCKPCNSMYKRDFFPTASRRQLGTDDAAVLRRERPFLINPADPLDGDPEELIQFRGPVPVAASTNLSDRQRALLTIELLRLDREDLVRERAWVIVNVWTAYRSLRDARQEDRDLAASILDALGAVGSPHSSCARTFRRLCETDEDAAFAEARIARTLL